MEKGGNIETFSLLKESEINWEITNQLKKEQKYITFLKWANDNGVIMQSVNILSLFF